MVWKDKHLPGFLVFTYGVQRWSPPAKLATQKPQKQKNNQQDPSCLPETSLLSFYLHFDFFHPNTDQRFSLAGYQHDLPAWKQNCFDTFGYVAIDYLGSLLSWLIPDC
jgi:hypothetical protein